MEEKTEQSDLTCVWWLIIASLFEAPLCFPPYFTALVETEVVENQDPTHTNYEIPLNNLWNTANRITAETGCMLSVNTCYPAPRPPVRQQVVCVQQGQIRGGKHLRDHCAHLCNTHTSSLSKGFWQASDVFISVPATRVKHVRNVWANMKKGCVMFCQPLYICTVLWVCSVGAVQSLQAEGWARGGVSECLRGGGHGVSLSS